MTEHLGFILVIPTLIVFVLAVWTRRPIESLIAGSIAGLLIVHGGGFIGAFAETSIRVLTDEDVAWVILVCGFMGSLIAILIRTGATAAFTSYMTRLVKSQKSALYVTWIIGIFMFVDDYLNSLAVGSAMRDLTDRYRISREKLAYLVICVADVVADFLYAVFRDRFSQRHLRLIDRNRIGHYCDAGPRFTRCV